MQQRYYDSMLGRFVSKDPEPVNTKDGSNFNRFNYAKNNPYRYTDPDGREWRAIAGGAVVGGIVGALGNGFSSWTQGNGFFNKDALKNGFIGGAISGAMVGAGGEPVLAASVGAGVTDALNQGASLTDPASFKNIDAKQLVITAVVGGATAVPIPGPVGAVVGQVVGAAIGGAIGNLVDFAKSLKGEE